MPALTACDVSFCTRAHVDLSVARVARMTGAAVSPLLAAETVAAFARDGFVVVPGLLSEDELDHYGAAVTAAVADRTRDDSTPLEQKSRYQQSFVQCMNLWEDHAEVAPLVFHPRVGQAAAELLGVPAVRLWHDQALFKRAGGRVTDPHQDHPYWPIEQTASVTAWIPFEGSTAASGAMSYLPGSHEVGLRKFVNIFFGEPEDVLADPEVAGIEPVLVEVPKGSVAFHHGLTVHLAGANRTLRDRAVQTIIYFPDGSTRGYAFPHFAVERGGIEVGDVIDSDVTPIAWPRPADAPIPPLPAMPFDAPPGVANTGATPTPRR
ncbi:MAG: phytanoyl-CoA dioxygenase family protein [Acidimicrobiia bacterium]